MKVRKKNKTAQINPKNLKNFVGKSDYGYTRKGGIAHAIPKSPTRGNSVFVHVEKIEKAEKTEEKK